MERIGNDDMDNRGYVFTSLTLLLIIPVIILAVSYNSIINEVNDLSVLVIGGDVTSTIGDNIIDTIQEDVADAGKSSAYNATRVVINNYNITNNPFFGLGGSKSYIINNTVIALNSNLTMTCRELESQTGRNITLNGILIDPNGTGTANVYQPGNLFITQSDPFGFYIVVPSVTASIKQNGQSLNFNIPTESVYIQITGLEDPYIWVNTKARTSSLIYQYPFYDSSNTNDPYELHSNISSEKLDYLWEFLDGQNSSLSGSRPYYFIDPNGLSFFDRLDGANNTTESPSARMSTFIIGDPLQEEHGNVNTSAVDHEYFSGVYGTAITTTDTTTGQVDFVKDPNLKTFYLSQFYKNFFKLANNYNYG
jgi:hypothetical protein